jgi:hypothetical protein
MPIDLDWQVTEAPQDDGPAAPRHPASRPPAKFDLGGRQPSNDPAKPAGRRRPYWLLALLLVFAGAAGSAWYLSAAGRRQVTGDLTALVRYEDEYSLKGEASVVLAVQDPSATDWRAESARLVRERRPAPLPVPRLELASAEPQLAEVAFMDGGAVRADVHRQYRAPDGEVLTFVLPQFYRRRGQTDWMRTTVPAGFWGTWHDWHSPHLTIRHSERDQALVQAIGPQLESIVAQACSLWAGECASALPANLYLSSYASTLGLDPLANVQMRVAFGDGAEGLPADSFITVASPHLSGVPAGDAAQRYLADYLAVRAIVGLAEKHTGYSPQAQGLIDQAVRALDLDHADPGFALRDTDPITVALSGAAAESAGMGIAVRPQSPPPPTATPALQTYVVRTGDTLLGIAESFGVPVAAILRANHIPDPDFILAGSRLLVPRPEEVGN